MTNPLNDPVLRKVAEQAADSLCIDKNDVVEIRADIAAHEWAYGMALYLESIGARPILTFLSVDYEHQRMCTLSAEWLRRPPPLTTAIAESIVATIIIKRDWRQPDTGCPKGKAASWNQAVGALTEQYDARRVRFCLISHPDPIYMDSGLSHEGVRENLSQALAADLADIQSTAQRISSELQNHSALTVLSGKSHRLDLKIIGRTIWRGDGLLRDDLVVNFPSGCVYVAPLEDSATGSVLIEQWQDVEQLVLTFHEGKLCEAKANKNLSRFTDLLETHAGDKDRISHIGIGINSALQIYTGQPAIDECRAGAVFVALGENRHLGGVNASTLNTDFVSRNASVVSGVAEVVRNGVLI
jgi:leucyl aminopeptidase (aminopeptidase T)